jgi:predicted nucleotidyltransferase
MTEARMGAGPAHASACPEVIMLQADRRVLLELGRRLRELEPRARVWAFGSRARETAEPESDLDVCVVVPEVTADLEQRIRGQAWEVAFENGLVIPTVILSEEDFDHGPMSASTLVENIRREGIPA